MNYQLLPPLSDEEYQALKQDIAERGVQVAVEYDEDGNILDGHHRVRACQELGITQWPSIVRVGLSEDEKIEHILKLNLHRRHLLSREWKQQKAAELRQQGWSLRRIAEALGIGLATAARWLNEKPDDEKCIADASNETPAQQFSSPETSTTITGRDGKRYPARRPYVLVDRPTEIQQAVQAIDVAGNTLPNKRIELHRLERIAREVDTKRRKENAAAKEYDDPDIRIHHCSINDLDIEPGSVDLIFTDPPYLKESIPLWDDLGRFAARALKPGALLIAYCGHFWLPEVMQRLAAHLRYVWTGTLCLPGAHARIRVYKIIQGARPLLFFSNGNYMPRTWIYDTVTSEGRQKEYHEWQQGIAPALYYIEHLTQPGELVVDPFLGSGTTAVAAKRLGRRFIGCDIDADAIASAKLRLENECSDGGI